MPEPVKESTPPLTAQGRYDQLRTERDPYDMRAREAAKVTLPSLVPPEGNSSATTFHTPWQSVGARGVNNLASKLLLTLFPPGSSFFKLEVAESVTEELKDAAGEQDDVQGELQAALSKIERAVLKKLESKNTRAMLFETCKHLLVAGNCLLTILPSGALKYFPLTSYVCKRDLSGNVIEVLTKESLSHRTLPKNAYAIVARKSAEQGLDEKKPLEIYTWVARKQDESWRVHQEICGERIPGSEGSYPKEKSAWIPLRWTAVANEDYGRGFVEEYLGDLLSLESLSQSLVDGAAAAAKCLIMVDEGGVTQRKTIAEAPNLAVVEGSSKDVTVLKLEKFADFSFAKSQADEVKQRLEQAFMLTSSIQRNAERVTAEEIRTMAAELEQSLGGVYSILAQELQRPLVVRLLLTMQQSRELPHLPEKSVSPQIVTGIEGLGRSNDLMRLDVFLAGAQQTLGPELVAEYVDAGDYLRRRAAALHLDTRGLVRTEEQVQESRQQQMTAALAEKTVPASIKADSDQAVAATKAAQPAASTAQ